MEGHVEYVGSSAGTVSREYTLRVRWGATSQDFTLAIPNEAFLSRRVRYQDAPEICFRKLQSALANAVDALLPARIEITDVDLEEYRAAHAPKPRTRKVPVVS